ncbi:NAD(P)(+)--arginine ADP-ribosyltransferase 2-like [Cheilinus undulatus]|uniref:NAD(P)(+)--arginine ADP-ribosyltransferase 2-like n=1 Tax=Cheilinus undulatus TaxID=241271 RepID=UPI001BD3286F|nr:NAD(P)(+)--arginine ADP-ribosyltransferase 2-like [Cheilinus undulatus]
MKAIMLILAPLCLLFGWMLFADSLMIRAKFPPKDPYQDFPLGMAEDSVDDMYFGCQMAMMQKVKSYYFQNEMRSKMFANAWRNATECAQKDISPKDTALTKDHVQAICVYTADDIYNTFNTAVREKGSTYGSSFHFHSLHFLLTSAIQILNRDYDCYTTYRRTQHVFNGNVNQTIRFGSFTSSSYFNQLTDFGNKTCFKINTCLGAYLKDYPTFYCTEVEVLIPPYEMFKITNKVDGHGKFPGLDDCKVVYELESVGVMSKLNCKALYP